MDNGNWSCDKEIIFQSSNKCMSKFIKHCKFTKKKLSNKKVKDMEEIRVRYQWYQLTFHHMILLKIVITLIPTTRTESMVLYPLTGNNKWNNFHHLLWLTLMKLGIKRLSWTCVCVYQKCAGSEKKIAPFNPVSVRMEKIEYCINI